jgi:hypothetical protein
MTCGPSPGTAPPPAEEADRGSGNVSRGIQVAVVRLGQAGYVARGAVIAGIGIAALDAAVTYDAAKA